jgi:hypothetical protein
VVIARPKPLYTPERAPILLVQETEWALGSVWTGTEKFALHRDSNPEPSTPQGVAISITLCRLLLLNVHIENYVVVTIKTLDTFRQRGHPKAATTVWSDST